MFAKILRSLDAMVNICIVITFSSMCIVIFLGVVTRYVFSYSLPWVEETGRFLFLAVSYLGIILAMRDQNHLRIDVLLMWMPKRMAWYCEIFSQIVCAAFFLFIVWEGFGITAKVYRLGQTAISLPLPIWIVWACIPCCALLSSLQCLKNIGGICGRQAGGEA